MKRACALAALIAGCVIATDWALNHLVVEQLGVYSIVNGSSSEIWRIPAIIVCAVALLLIQPTRWESIGVGLAAGGVIANTLDRALFGPVTDFITVDSNTYYNLADLCIGAGIIIAAVSYSIRFVVGWRAARAALR